jgi:hypothetical protein
MNADQITTIITNVLTGTGVVCFLGMVIKGLKDQITGLKTQIGTLNETIDVQKKTLEAMETRVLETEKVGNIYKRLTEELPAEIDKYRSLIMKLKDDQISELEKANQDKDEKLKKTAEIEIEKLNLQQQALEDIPGLRRELITVVTTLEQRLATVEQLSSRSAPQVVHMGNVYRVQTGGAITVRGNRENGSNPHFECQRQTMTTYFPAQIFEIGCREWIASDFLTVAAASLAPKARESPNQIAKISSCGAAAAHLISYLYSGTARTQIKEGTWSGTQSDYPVKPRKTKKNPNPIVI